MKYVSTRGRAPEAGFAAVSLAGLAADGGLYVPERWPALAEPAALAKGTYAEAALSVMSPFCAPDLSEAELARLIAASVSVFPGSEPAPLKELSRNLYVMELFHGPTLAFKDVALQFLGHLFDLLLERRGGRVTIVGATSGDTGSAAIAAFRGKKNADIFILHPKGRVSDVQRRQMTTVADSNVHNIAVEGSFDDCQDIVKALFADAAFREETRLSAVNSINWARILAQAVYYARAGAQVLAQTGRVPAFSVPTGNFGNVYAGRVAAMTGAPVGRLCVATNANDILHRFFETGRMKAEAVVPTTSPSMDIQVASNFERLLFEIFGRQGAAVERTLRHFREEGPFHLEPPAMEALRARFTSARFDDAAVADVIRRTQASHGYLLDPHSATGVGAAELLLARDPETPVVSLATAHPAKFPEAVKAAAGIAPPEPESLAGLRDLPERLETLPADAARVMAFVRAHMRFK